MKNCREKLITDIWEIVCQPGVFSAHFGHLFKVSLVPSEFKK